MKLPNKIVSYDESILSKAVVLLEILSKKDMNIMDLYSASKKQYKSVSDYIETLDCLYLLNKIVFIEESEMIHIVI